MKLFILVGGGGGHHQPNFFAEPNGWSIDIFREDIKSCSKTESIVEKTFRFNIFPEKISGL